MNWLFIIAQNVQRHHYRGYEAVLVSFVSVCADANPIQCSLANSDDDPKAQISQRDMWKCRVELVYKEGQHDLAASSDDDLVIVRSVNLFISLFI